MHEAGISEALLEQLATASSQHGWSRLSRVWVRLGLLSGIVPEALEFAFKAMSVGTPAEGAELVFETEAGQFECEHCGKLEHACLDFICPKCGGALRLLHAGRGLLLCGVEPIAS